MTLATDTLNSIGYLAGTLQHDPREIMKAATTLGIEPALVLNGVTHFSGEQTQSLATYFRETKIKKGSK